jgi:hypothetical protein
MKNNIAYGPGNAQNAGTDNVGATFLHLPNTPTLVEGVNFVRENNSSNTQVNLTRPWAAASPVAAVDFTPSGSYAVDGGTWVPVYKNYFGTTNSAPREIGAI